LEKEELRLLVSFKRSFKSLKGMKKMSVGNVSVARIRISKIVHRNLIVINQGWKLFSMKVVMERIIIIKHIETAHQRGP
jgi:hypothetical protein